MKPSTAFFTILTSLALAACSGEPSYRKVTTIEQNSDGEYTETTKIKGQPPAVYQEQPMQTTTTRTRTIERVQ
jgi:hypothetical protein